VGTLVWDRIIDRDPLRAPVEEWGGMAYALSGFSAALPEGWEVVPIVKVGRDLGERALRFLRSLPRVSVGPGVVLVSEPNNRVELRYQDVHRRTEHLSGGVPPWQWTELAPLLSDCDALYVNFISGMEMGLDTAMAIRTGFHGPTYVDLHSLFLGVSTAGLRVPQLLPSWGKWLRSFDAAQVNEDEFALLGRNHGDPWEMASEVVGPDLKLLAVTLGGEGSAYVAGAGFRPDPGEWPELRRRVAIPGPATSRKIPARSGTVEGDPTGCGDVWGATFFSRLLAGDALDTAMEFANEAAARNVTFRGARGLHLHLSGRLAPVEEQR
jgi:sugar/nucleoside kinase (ribokinase family)